MTRRGHCDTVCTMTQQIDESTARKPSAPGSSAVRIIELCLSYDARRVLRQISLDIPAGQSVALMGANGAGKSTLLKILATLLHPTSGTVQIFGCDVTAGAVAGARAKVGIISHQSMLYRELSARENVEFFAALYDTPDAPARTTEVLEAVGMIDRADDPVKTLSRGMTQRVAIARAMVHEPELLLADEPFDGLDATSARLLEELLAGLHAQGKTVVMANHDIAQSLRVAERAVVLRQGKIAMDCATGDVTVSDVLAGMTGS